MLPRMVLFATIIHICYDLEKSCRRIQMNDTGVRKGLPRAAQMCPQEPVLKCVNQGRFLINRNMSGRTVPKVQKYVRKNRP